MDKQKTIEKLNSYNKNTLMETLAIEFVGVGEDFLVAYFFCSRGLRDPRNFGVLIALNYTF